MKKLVIRFNAPVVLLFALPLAVVVPFQTELFSDDPIAVES